MSRESGSGKSLQRARGEISPPSVRDVHCERENAPRKNAAAQPAAIFVGYSVISFIQGKRWPGVFDALRGRDRGRGFVVERIPGAKFRLLFRAVSRAHFRARFLFFFYFSLSPIHRATKKLMIRSAAYVVAAEPRRDVNNYHSDFRRAKCLIDAADV